MYVQFCEGDAGDGSGLLLPQKFILKSFLISDAIGFRFNKQI